MMPAVTITSSYDLLQHIKSSSATHSLLARGVLVSCTNTPGSHPVLALSCRKVCQCWPRSKIEHIPSRIHSMSAKMCSKVHPKSIRGEFHANHCNCLKRSTCVTRILPSISWQMLLWLSTKRPIKISCQCRNIMKIDEVECIVQTPTNNNRQLAKKCLVIYKLPNRCRSHTKQHSRYHLMGHLVQAELNCKKVVGSPSKDARIHKTTA